MLPAAIGIMIVSAAISSTGCNLSTPAHDSQEYSSEIEALAVDRKKRDPLVASQTRGRKLYAHYCAICHGEDGEGNGFNSTNLNVPPRNFTDPAFWKQSTEKRIVQAVREGGESVGKSVLMPAWGRTLSEQQISDVIVFLRTFEKQPQKQTENPPDE